MTYTVRLCSECVYTPADIGQAYNDRSNDFCCIDCPKGTGTVQQPTWKSVRDSTNAMRKRRFNSRKWLNHERYLP